MRSRVALALCSLLTISAPRSASTQSVDVTPLQVMLDRSARRLQNETTLGNFYASNGWQRVFVDDSGALTERGVTVRDALREVIERNMLDTSTLGVAAANAALLALGEATGDQQVDEAASRLELAVADVVTRVADELRYSHEAAVPEIVEDVAAWRSAELQTLLNTPTDELAAAIHGLTPTYENYAEMADAIALYRAIEADGGWPELELEVESTSPEDAIVALRERLALEGYITDTSTTVWDEALAASVLRYQQAHQIRHPLDRVGPQTLDLLNEGVRNRLGTMIATLDRMRAGARDPDGLGDLVHVNVAGFRVEVWGGQERIFTARVIVGDTRDEDGHETRRWQTPLFDDEMERIELNPVWYVPPSIEREVRLNAELGIIRRGDQVLQLPGPQNMLGRVKFVFPNNNSVYLHDTLYPQLFDRPIRTFSHGCIRLDHPLDLATILIARDQQRDESEVRTWIDGILETTETEVVVLQRPLPVAIEYYTSWVADDGVVEFYSDVYRLTRRDERAARGRSPQQLLPDGE